MKFTVLSLFLFLINLSLFAQNLPTGGNIKVSGIIEDSLSARPVAGSTVTISFQNNNKTISRQAVADLNGKFFVDNIPSNKKIRITVSAVGYINVSKEIFLTNPISGNNVFDAGKILLNAQTNTLQSVVVTTRTTPAMQFGIDSKIFNVEKNITAQGGTAVDVMKNIPSLSVDAQGNVLLRNSPPQIFIDGRPTILTLDQIAADDIEKVELITNPSAKFDASSSAGIINIILKKNKRVGLNGIASIGGGSPQLFNGNINLNLRQKKFNLFANGNYFTSGGIAKEETYRENKKDGVITDYFLQSTNNDRTRRFYSIRFGADYFIDNETTLSFTQSFNNGRFGNDEIQNQQYLDNTKALQYTGVRATNGSGNFNRASSRLSFERRFNSADHKLTADITYNNGSRDNANLTINDFYNPDGSIYQPDTRVRNNGSGNDHQIIGQVDYSHKITDDKRIEFGLRTFYNNTSSKFGTYSIDEGGSETKLPLSNNIKYTENVSAGYFNYANKWKSLIYQVGLRVELSKLDGTLIDSNVNFGYKFPDGFKDLGYALFPSFFITKHLNETEDVQLNYSKRIRRPRFWQVNPFINIDDPMNISVGNPALKPEYTNSFELNYSKTFNNRGGSFLASVYFKNNVGDITDYSDTIPQDIYDQLSNAGVSPDAILNTYINAGHTNSLGGEFTIQKNITKQFDLTYNISLQYNETKASVNKKDLSNQGFNFQTKLISNYKIVTDASRLFNNLGFQLIAEYEGPEVIPQGKEKAQFGADFAMRKEFLKNKKASLSFSVNDIFNTRKYGTIYDTEEFYQDAYERWNVRSFRLTFSYKFGNTDIFRKKENNNNTQDEERPDFN
jgi:outer membrane receptor protein involved in Fe transport